MTESLIKCENVSFSYENVIVSEEICFTVNSGDYLCILGENGAGKSTLMKGLLGLKQPCRGQIIMGDGLKQNEIGYLPQQTTVQRDFPASVFEVVISGCLNKRKTGMFYSADDKKRAAESMERLGIGDLKKKSYRSLSGGQQQRVLLARALCATEKLLLLDEPVTGLDPSASYEMYRLISEINSKYGITVIMISHDIKTACGYASKVLHINKKQLFFGDVDEYINSDVAKRFVSISKS